jgi:hypothetical protein
MVDGTDLFADPGRPAGLSCRLYRLPDGVSGIPGLRDLRQALKRAADRTDPAKPDAMPTPPDPPVDRPFS